MTLYLGVPSAPRFNLLMSSEDELLDSMRILMNQATLAQWNAWIGVLSLSDDRLLRNTSAFAAHVPGYHIDGSGYP